MEAALIPVFNYMDNPRNIEFDDDILQLMTTFMKKSQKVSPTMIAMFPHLPAFYDKYKGVFGSLLQTLNAFIYYGKEIIGKNSNFIEIVSLLCIINFVACKNGDEFTISY